MNTAWKISRNGGKYIMASSLGVLLYNSLSYSINRKKKKKIMFSAGVLDYRIHYYYYCYYREKEEEKWLKVSSSMIEHRHDVFLLNFTSIVYKWCHLNIIIWNSQWKEKKNSSLFFLMFCLSIAASAWQIHLFRNS